MVIETILNMGRGINKEQYLEALGTELRLIRKRRGWTLEETEEHGWKSWRHLQKIEAGKNITLATLLELSALYGIPPEKILSKVKT